jgi:hypothetical protein
MADPRAALREKFRAFKTLEGGGYSPLYERLSSVIAEDERLLAILDDAPAHQRQPTLFFAALQDRVLAHGGEPLARWYPSVTGKAVPDDDVADALRSFCAAHERELRGIVAQRSTQTNEVLRCAALLLAFARIDTDRPLALVDLGSSAGLNLALDRYHYEYDGVGTVGDDASLVRLRTVFKDKSRPRLPAIPRIGSRVGVDLLPVDPSDEAETRWLQACVFADQPERHQRLRAALEIARVHPPRLIKGNMLDELPRIAAETPPDQHLTVIDTWATHYLTKEERQRFAGLLQEIGRTRDLSYIAANMAGVVVGLEEPSVDPQAPHATLLSLTRFRGGRRSAQVLARMHSHAAWIEWLL